jgi:hypothetical protein
MFRTPCVGVTPIFSRLSSSRVKAVRHLRTEAQAAKIRKELLVAHLAERLSGRRLQERVNDLFRASSPTTNRDEPISRGKWNLKRSRRSIPNIFSGTSLN